MSVAAVAATVAAALLHLLLHRLHELLERDRNLDTSRNPAPLPCEATFFLEPKDLPFTTCESQMVHTDTALGQVNAQTNEEV